MGNKKPEKKDKNPLKPEQFVVHTGAAVDLLLHGKTPAYEKRFKSWAKNTNGEHLDNLVDALLSATAFAMVTGKSTVVCPDTSVEYLRGQTQGLLMMQEYIRTYASETSQTVDDDAGDLTDLLN